MPLTILIVCAALFVLCHIGLSTNLVKKPLSKMMGDGPYMLVYSLISFAAFGGAIYAYAILGARGPTLWVVGGWTDPLVYLLMIMSILFIVLSSATPSPVGMATGAKPEARGILRVTSHPQNMGMICFGLAHLYVTGTIGGITLYGTFVVLGIFGSWHETVKTAKNARAETRKFLDETGVLPFAAILRGRNRFVAGEFKFGSILAAGVAFGVAIGLHFLVR